jgi:SPP1 gp7 family putative phage head morphogenesis protein
MAQKKTFNNPDSQEREYTRLLLRYSKQLQADVNSVLVPRLDDIVLQYKVESRSDSWIDTLDALMAELARLALTALGSVVTKLPGMFSAVSKFNEGQFKLVVKANTGLPLPPVMPGAPSSSILGVNVFRSEPFLKPLAEGWISENTALIKSLPTRLHPELEGIIRRGVMNGQSVKELKEQIKARYGVSDYRAKLIAQDQTLKLNADLTRYRLQSVGVKEYVWRSVQDSRVRPEHADRNGKTYSWDKGPSNGQHPGQEVRCRCRAEAVWDDEQEELASEAPVAPTGRPGGVAGADEPKPVSATSAKVAERVNNSVLYHGTGKQFDKFSLSKLHTGADEGADSWYGHGIYLSGEKWKASSYAYAAGASGRIVSAKAVIRNPFVVSDTSASALTDALKALGIDPSTPPSALTKKLKERGYDSVVVLSERKGTINEVVLFNDKSVQIVGSEGL